MATQRHIVTLLLWLSFLATGLKGADDIHHDVAEGSIVDLTYNAKSAGGEVYGKNWWRGRVTPGGIDGTQLFGWNGIKLNKITNRTDMSVPDTNSFTMRIGDVRLEDEDTFTCQATDIEGAHYGYHVLSVYVLPKVSLTGLEKSYYRENETVTVTCDIPRVKPQPSPDSVTFTWGSDDISMTESTNQDDGTVGYSGTHPRKLSRTDNGKTVTCRIVPVKGEPVQIQKVLDVQYGPRGVPKITAPKEDYYLEDTVTLTCDQGSVTDTNPPIHKYVWYKHDTSWRETSGRTHGFAVEGADDAGNYSCAMANDISETATSETIPIRVHLITGVPIVLASDTEVDLKDNVTLKCDIDKVTSNDDIDIFQWYKNNTEQQEAASQVYNFTIDTEEDATKYSCVAGNRYICTKASEPVEIRLKIPVPPWGSPIIEASEHKVRMNDTVTLLCNTSQVLTGEKRINQFHWYKDKILDCASEWHIYNFTMETSNDAVNYSCAAGNDLGFTNTSLPVEILLAEDHGDDPGAGTSTAAIAGGVAAGVVLILIIAVVAVYMFRRRSPGRKGTQGHSGYQENASLEHVVAPPAENGEAQYAEIDTRKKPIPAKRSLKKPEEPLYSEAAIEGPVYSEVNKGENAYANVGDVDRNQNQNPGLVYADLMLSNGPQQPGSDGVRPAQSQPTEYARIDFNKRPQ